MKLAISFTNLGPYHLARLRAAAMQLATQGGRVVAIETAGTERRYPWQADQRAEPFDRIVLFPGKVLEDLTDQDCALAMEEVLDAQHPDAVAVSGYVRPEVMAAARWARRMGRPSVLMSESQEIDRPRQWWKEAIKRHRLRVFDAALVGGASHQAYLEVLGMPSDRITMGYNAVDNAAFANRTDAARRSPEGRNGIPDRPYFLSVCRFAEEKNLPMLIDAYGEYCQRVGRANAWDLILCGGGPEELAVQRAVTRCGAGQGIHRPGFLQEEELAPWYAFASAFVLASVSEPWGLVVNEAAASGLPLLVSDRVGAAGTLVPEPTGTTGMQFDPTRVEAIAEALTWMATRSDSERESMGERAAECVADWGPERFGKGLLDAVDRAVAARTRPKLRRAS
ncbi:glycosyltransferase family 4 protein [Tautonia marina]|uniref:glycosyltransferase family 4 protein n=1 Tax=Tautonia marina TaxID=2653855 RepID=UPI001261276F|nr:glycosyltransferase family 4 protein [Tautonia marina]